MYNNTTSSHPTHFLRGNDLVVEATKDYEAHSENWPFPTQYRYGIPQDDYYVEIWVNGMDWQANYWAIEEFNLQKPQIKPFIIFEDHEEQKKFKSYNFASLIRASLYYRRDLVFVKHKNYSYFTDMVWPHLYVIDNELEFKVMKHMAFEHEDQQKVEFWMNPEFILPSVFERKDDEKNRCDRNPKTQLGGSLEKNPTKTI